MLSSPHLDVERGYMEVVGEKFDGKIEEMLKKGLLQFF